MFTRITHAGLILCLTAGIWQSVQVAEAQEGRWKRTISYQSKNDLFANYQVGPNPSGTAAQMYVSPVPVPPFVGHTYTTYQPWMPHEYLYKHCRTHYAYSPGSGGGPGSCGAGAGGAGRGGGWTRAKIRYGTFGLRIQDCLHDLNPRF